MPLLLEWTKPAIANADEIIDYIFADNPAAAFDFDFDFDFEQIIHESANNLTVPPYLSRLGMVTKTRELIFHSNKVCEAISLARLDLDRFGSDPRLRGEGQNPAGSPQRTDSSHRRFEFAAAVLFCFFAEKRRFLIYNLLKGAVLDN